MNLKCIHLKGRKMRRVPDKRIIITNKIIMIEYNNGQDLVLTREHDCAKRLMEAICLK